MTADRLLADLQLEMASLRHALDREKEDADRLRGLWPRAELQRLHLDLAARTVELATLRREHDALAASTVGRMSAPIFRVLERLRPAATAARMAARLLRLPRTLPERIRVRRQHRADMAVLAASPLFDREWYRARAMGADSASDPVAHYVWLGAAAGHDPHPLFNGAWYATQHPELGRANPFAHYVALGMAADADPHPVFDTVYYLSQAPEAAGRALAHYAASPVGETRSPSPLFDPASYAADNPAAAANPLAHYARIGAAQDRDPHPLFHAAWYRAEQCGADPNVNPLARWMRSGGARNLPPNPWGLRPGTLPRFAHPAPAVSVIVLPSASAIATARTLISAAGDAVEVILAATDGPAWPGLRSLQAEPGPNWSARVNAAARLARAPLIAILGADTVAYSGWLRPMLALMQARASIGAVSPFLVGLAAGATSDCACRVDTAPGEAVLLRTEAFWAAGGFDETYDSSRWAAASLAQSMQGQGLQVWLQPASRVACLAPAAPKAAADRERFEARWAAAVSTAPVPRRTVLVLSDAVPNPGDPALQALHALLDEGALAVLGATGKAEPSGWFAERGVLVLPDDMALADWLTTHGGTLDEVWSFRAAADVPVAALLRLTGAALLQCGDATRVPSWCDGAVGPERLRAA